MANNPAVAAAVCLPEVSKDAERYTLLAETELRLEVSSSSSTSGVSITLQRGSAEVFGVELALQQSHQYYHVSSSCQIAIFTWHGCTVDVSPSSGQKLFAYTSTETAANVAFVNTHAQLEALRDEALSCGNKDGPRVLVVGPADCGKTSLVQTLLAYAVKLGRSPLLIDLDVSQNMLSVPGTIAAAPMTPDAISVSSYASKSIVHTSPMVLWYGSTELSVNPDLYMALLDRMGRNVNERFHSNQDEEDDARASGFIVNTCGWIEDVGYKLLLHAADALRINVVLVLGHDRLYSMLKTHFAERDITTTNDDDNNNDEQGGVQSKVIKLPRSGGVVSRDVTYRSTLRNLSIKHYFNGEETISSKNQYTPSLLEIPFHKLQLYKLSSVSLAASMLPVSAKQSTDPVQLTAMHEDDIGSFFLQHSLLAVCHPSAVDAYELSGQASDLYLSGIAGFVAVEKVNMEKEIVSLLSPCSGALPSHTLLVGDITWME